MKATTGRHFTSRPVVAAAVGTFIAALVAGCAVHPRPLLVAEDDARANEKAAPAAGAPSKVYGEWRIRVKPDKGAEYDRLIETKGLPLFRAAGGKMVGWWKTLVGDLYEQVTIWEYDGGMPAFEKAIGFLGPNPDFQAFVAARDPLLTGEEARFLAPAAVGEAASGPIAARFVVHEIHRVPLPRREEYLRFMAKNLPLLRSVGFRPVGPLVTAVGTWSEVTYLYLYDSLRQRDELIAALNARPEGREFSALLRAHVGEISTRLLVPASFAK